LRLVEEKPLRANALQRESYNPNTKKRIGPRSNTMVKKENKWKSKVGWKRNEEAS